MADFISVEGIMNHLWLSVKSNPRINNLIGIKYISHRWGETPFWYLWLHDVAGVYKLELKNVQSSVGYEWIAEFAVKYYPAEEEPYFEGLSLLEQLCRKGIAFQGKTSRSHSGCPCHALHSSGEEVEPENHSTGCPGLEYQDNIPDEFFFAGKIMLAKYGTNFIVGCEAQTYWKVIMSANYYLDDECGNSYKVLRQGEIDRDYPGLEITNFFYKKLQSCLLMLNKHSEITEKGPL